jgi:hypothetical protein
MKLSYVAFALIGVFLFITTFAQQKKSVFDFSQKVIDECIKVHGGKKYKKAHYSYDFRDKAYAYKRKNGDYTYSRTYTDKQGNQLKDVLTNDAYSHFVNGVHKKDLDPKNEFKYREAVNSVHYFAFLPYFLNDGAVNKKYLGLVDIKGKKYHEIQVTFDQEGGGVDHEDVYVYWIQDETFTLDYLAYSFQVNGGGVRFREAYNPREVGGIRFQDYINYKHEDKMTPVHDLDQAFVKGELKELSRIDLENITSL